MTFEADRWQQYMFRGLQSLKHEHHVNYRIKHNDRSIQTTTLLNGTTFAKGFAMKQQQEEIVFAPRFGWGEFLVAQQSKWIIELKAHVEHNDVAEIIEYHDTEKGPIAVSDGSEETQTRTN